MRGLFISNVPSASLHRAVRGIGMPRALLSRVRRLLRALLLACGCLALSVQGQPVAGPNLIVTSDAPQVRLDGAFERVEAARARSASVLRAVGGGGHRALIAVDPGVRGYYRVSVWRPQAGGAGEGAEVVVHDLARGAQRVALAADARAGQWIAAGVFELPAAGAQIELVERAGEVLVVDALRLQYVGAATPALAFDSDALPVAVAGARYAASIAMVDGTPPYRFEVDAASVPPGLELDAGSGTLSGVPSAPGRYRLQVEVFDGNGARVQRAFELAVVAGSRGAAASGAPELTKAAEPVVKDGVAAGAAPDLSGLIGLIAALPEGEWTQASLNTYQSVWAPAELRPLFGVGNPDPSKIILAWSGFAWDPNRGDLLLYGGGHANYSGNDVYRWRGRTRQWERASLPSEIKQDDLGNWEAVDGWDAAPPSAHTYDTTSFFPHIDRAVMFGGASYSSGWPYMREVTPTTQRITGPFFFDPARADANKVGGTTGSHVKRVAPHPEIVGGNMWSNRDLAIHITNNPQNLGSYANGCAAYAEENGKDVAYLGARPPGGSTATNLYKYTVNALSDPTRDTYEQVGRFWNGTDGETACAVDPVRKLFVKTGNPAIPFVYWDLSTPGAENRDVRVTPVDPTGEFAAQLASGGVNLLLCGLDFDATRARFALWCGGGGVWLLTPPATASPQGWTIQRQRTPVGAQPSPDAGVGILGKWKYIWNLDAFIALQDPVQGNVWVYKPVGWVNPKGGSAPGIAAPTNVNASDGTSTAGVSISWSASANATGYTIYRSTNFGTQGSAIGTSPTTGFVDAAASPGTTYYYGVTASGASGTSALSAQDSGFRAIATPPPPPPAGAVLSGSAVLSALRVNLSAVGNTDWAHWPPWTHKATGGALISKYTALGNATVLKYFTGQRRY